MVTILNPRKVGRGRIPSQVKATGAMEVGGVMVDVLVGAVESADRASPPDGTVATPAGAGATDEVGAHSIRRRTSLLRRPNALGPPSATRTLQGRCRITTPVS
mmetsp:Transcript_16212/g.32873  ORF Transcript_16212/g.32873 Transcript_16212/m.32873 type:complete len:103 (+) Transcript_16212:696-1004(+)